MNCPLCQKELLQDESDCQQLYCPVVIPDLSNGGFRFHYYYLKSDGRAYIYVDLYMEDYRVMEVRKGAPYTSIPDGKSEFHIYKWNAKYGTWHWIGASPIFDFSSEKQLMKRIKTIMVFS